MGNDFLGQPQRQRWLIGLMSGYYLLAAIIDGDVAGELRVILILLDGSTVEKSGVNAYQTLLELLSDSEYITGEVATIRRLDKRPEFEITA